MVLAIIAIVIFGPDQLPKAAAQAGRALRELRRMAEGARRDLTEGLGPEVQDFALAALPPRASVRRPLLADLEPDPLVAERDPLAAEPDPLAAEPASVAAEPYPQAQATTVLAPGETPPYDSEAT